MQFPEEMRGERLRVISNGQKFIKETDSDWELGNNGTTIAFTKRIRVKES